MAVNKVIYGGDTLIDISDTTAVANDVASGKYFYTRDGVRTQGTNSGGGGGATVKTATKTVSSNGTSIQFTGLDAEPKMFYVEPQNDISLNSSSSSTRYVAGVFFDGENMSGSSYDLTGNRATNIHHNTSNFSKTYANGTLTINSGSYSTGGYFRSGVTYKLTYVY